MKRVFALFVGLLVAVGCWFPVCADDPDDLDNRLDISEDGTIVGDRDFVYGTDQILDDIYWLLNERLPLGDSAEDLEKEEPELLPEVPEPPPIHLLVPAPIGTKPVLFSIGSQSAYPYTGGAFIAMNTNYGNGLAVFVENYKKDTFGYIKNTSRIVNLSNAAVSGYWVMGGITYQLQAARLGEFQYYYNQGPSSGWGWRALTVSAVTDSNIQFLDETGQRGVENVVLQPYEKIMLSLALIGVLSLLFFRRRS